LERSSGEYIEHMIGEVHADPTFFRGELASFHTRFSSAACGRTKGTPRAFAAFPLRRRHCDPTGSLYVLKSARTTKGGAETERPARRRVGGGYPVVPPPRCARLTTTLVEVPESEQQGRRIRESKAWNDMYVR
jgi:hypothetical protein